MRGNSFGQLLTVTTFGESHGIAMGAIIDGCPAGVPLTLEDFERALDRRRPGQSSVTTDRNEADAPEILSGVFEGKTLGTPICVVVRNRDQRSKDYEPTHYRAGHADRVWDEKFGHRDYRGGGRASGRETIGRVIGGVVAQRIVESIAPVRLSVYTKQIGDSLFDTTSYFDRETIEQSVIRMPDPQLTSKITKELEACKRDGDSRGGVVQIYADGVPPGLGEPVFNKFKNALANACMSIGAVIGFEFGDATVAASASGKDFHSGTSGSSDDPEAGRSPSAHGVQGGLSNGLPIDARVTFKPASTVGKKAQEGRHDPCIVPRAVPVVEAMTWIVLADFLLSARTDRINFNTSTT